MSDFTRRSLLRSALAVGGAHAFGSLLPLTRPAQAGGAKGGDHHYIFCYFGGGWDPLLSLDPRDPSVYTPAAVGDTLTDPAYDRLQANGHIDQPFTTANGLFVGPYLGDLAAHAEKIAIVRGMSMDTLSHNAGRMRFLTGRPPAGDQPRGSAIATWPARARGEGQITPNMSLRVDSVNLDLPSWATAASVANVGDLLRALRPPSQPAGPAGDAAIAALLSAQADCPRALRSEFWQQAEEARRGARDLVERNLAERFDFTADTPEMEAIREHYGFDTSRRAQGEGPALAAAAVQAVTSGITRVATARVAAGLDTHSVAWASEQGPNQEAGWNLIARMAEDLASRAFGDRGDSWLDHTTILAYSEFGRAARLNGQGGRDHSLCSSCLLLGGNIRGGQVIGKSTDVAMMPHGADLLTGAPDPEGTIIRPDHVLRGLLVDAGFESDVADLRVDPLRALFNG